MRLFCRRLHARHVKHASKLLAPTSNHINSPATLPARGLLLRSSPVLPALWAVGGLVPEAAPAAQLVRALWHRHEPQEPLRYTRNRSLPGSHLAENPKLLGHLLGLALANKPTDDTVKSLQTLGVGPLSRRTKVSLSRFARIVDLSRDGLNGDIVCTTTILCCFLWDSATSKSDLVSFFEAAASHLPHGALLGNEYNREQWLSHEFSRDDLIDGTPSAIAAASHLASREHDNDALELLAYAMASRGSERPEVEQARHGYMGQKAKPDCVEAVARDAISLALWDFSLAAFDINRLPATADPRLKAFFASRHCYSSGHEAGGEWFQLCANRKPSSSGSGALKYLSGSSDAEYELAAHCENVLLALNSLLGCNLTPPTESLQPVWEGAHVGWEVYQRGTDRPVLRFRPIPQASSPTTTSRGTEQLSLIFTEGVHCYALRRVQREEPMWLNGLRTAWMRLWREDGISVLGGDKAIAASALLGASMLHATAHVHRSSSTTTSSTTNADDRTSTLLAVLSATPHGYEERTAALQLTLRDQSTWWLLPLLLQPPPSTNRWDSLTLGSCAELLTDVLPPSSNSTSAVEEALVKAAEASPPLQALVALRANRPRVVQEALSRCSDEEAAVVLRVALGFAGYSVRERVAACREVGASWWRERRTWRGARWDEDAVFS